MNYAPGEKNERRKVMYNEKVRAGRLREWWATGIGRNESYQLEHLK